MPTYHNRGVIFVLLLSFLLLLLLLLLLIQKPTFKVWSKSGHWDIAQKQKQIPPDENLTPNFQEKTLVRECSEGVKDEKPVQDVINEDDKSSVFCMNTSL